MLMVMEKSCDMINWEKVLGFCDQPWNFTDFVPNFYQICVFIKTKHFSISVKAIFEQRGGHGKFILKKSHRNVY